MEQPPSRAYRHATPSPDRAAIARSWVLTDPPGAKSHTHSTRPIRARQDGRYPNASPTRASC